MIKYRPMKAWDYPFLIALWEEVEEIDLKSRDDSYINLLRFLDRNPKHSWIATDQDSGKLIGALLCATTNSPSGSKATIHHLSVSPSFRRQGIARHLVNLVQNDLRQEGIGSVNLTTYSENEDGLAFWKALGYDVQSDRIFLEKEIQKSEEKKS